MGLKEIVAATMLSLMPLFLNGNKEVQLNKEINLSHYDSDCYGKNLSEGVDLIKCPINVKSSHGDSILKIVKIDPNKRDFQFYTYKEHNNDHTASEWAEKYDLELVINAGMFDFNYDSIGYMRTNNLVINDKDKGAYNNAFVFNPKKKGLPEADIIDLKETPLSEVKKNYSSILQSIRMLKGNNINTWQRSNRKWSSATLGKDKEGYILFLHSRSPYTMNDFINVVKNEVKNIGKLMYLEGGPEATLSTPDYIYIGSYETNFYDNSNNKEWKLPNVIGLNR